MDNRTKAPGVRYHGAATELPMADAIGPKLNKYEIVDQISAGGMGAVYLAEDTSLHRQVAIKVLSPELADDPDRFQRFQWEARVLARLNHPNIVTIFSVEEDAKGIHFLTMELVDGETLGYLLPEQGLPLRQLFEIAIPLADALSAAHQQGIIHRDLKPGNIMVRRDGRVKVLDFGLAKQRQDLDATALGLRGQQPETQDGQLMGTVPYMSPEQIQSGEIDHRTDIFSLGIILFEMATGSRPFQGKNWGDLASAILRDRPPSVTMVKSRLPRHLGRIIRHCLEKDPQRRFQTALDLRNELEELRREWRSGELDVASLVMSSSGGGPASGSGSAGGLGSSGGLGSGGGLASGEGLGSGGGLASGGGVGLRGPSGVIRNPLEETLISEGLKARGQERWRRYETLMALAASIVVIAFLATWVWWRSTHTGGTAPNPAAPVAQAPASAPKREEKRIVVLPMENLGPADHAYFAAGITEEITSRLAAVSALHVISRTTASGYDRQDKTMQQIGAELGVDYLLEGSVRWGVDAEGKTRVRVTPQLIRVADDTQIWSERYDQVIDDIFAVQSSIAEKVIQQLDIALLEPEREALASAPTENLEAYQLYLEGTVLASRGAPTRENWERVVALLEEAVVLDPDFALAWVELSEAHAQAYYLILDPSPERVDKARQAIDRAMAIDPDLPAAHRALGYYYYWCHGDHEAALAEFAKAARALPNDSQLLQGIAYIRRRQGRFEEAAGGFVEALRLDPQSAVLATELGRTYTLLRRYLEADTLFQRAIDLNYEDPVPFQEKAMNLLLWRGDLAGARDLLTAMPGQEEIQSVMAWYRLELFEEDYEAALERIESTPVHIIGVDWAMMPKQLLRGEIFRALGQTDKARLQFASARVLLERIVRMAPEDPRRRSALARVYAGLGQAPEASRQARLAVDLVPRTKNAQMASELLENLAEVSVMVGDHDTAIETLGDLLTMPAKVSQPLLRLDPRWHPLRQDPRFVALVGEPQLSPK